IRWASRTSTVTPQRWFSVQAGASRPDSSLPVMDSVTPLEVVNRWYQGTPDWVACALGTGAATRSWACATPAVARMATPAIRAADALDTTSYPSAPLQDCQYNASRTDPQ